LTLQDNFVWRYRHSFNSFGSGPDTAWYGTVSNTDLQGVVLGNPNSLLLRVG
jgi:hypothetical protein